MIYTIRKGDTLSRIARRAGISMSLIKSRNPIIKDPDKIQVGWKIKLPGYAEVKALKKIEKETKIKIPALSVKKTETKPLELGKTGSPSYYYKKFKQAKTPRDAGVAFVYYQGALRKEAARTLRLKSQAKERKIFVLKETMKGLPKATQTVLEAIDVTMRKIPAIKQVMKGLDWWTAKLNKVIRSAVLKGTPSTKELENAVNEIKELQKKNLPPQIYFKQVRKIIEDIPIR